MGNRIVLMDDSREMRSVLSSALASAGHEVRLAPSLVEATEEVVRELPEMVLVDIDDEGLPPAEEVVRSLQGLEGAAALPVVLISNRQARELAALARQVGATGAIPRDKLPDEVARWWEKLQRHRAQLSRPPTSTPSFVSIPPRPTTRPGPPPGVPAAPGSTPPASQPAASGPSLSRPPGLGFEGVAGSGGVLVVDDSAVQRFLLRDQLEAAGLPVTCTGTVGCAVEVLKKFKPRLILLDMNLPDMRGDQVCARLKQSATFRDVRILFISGEREEVLEEATRRVGADGYLRKPFGIRDLMAELAHVGESARAAPEKDWPLPVLLKGLHDESPLARARAARAIGTRKEVDGVLPLRGLLRDQVPEVVSEALWALGQMPDANVMIDVQTLFSSGREVALSSEVRLRAIELMEKIGGKVVLALLAGFLEPDRPDEERLRVLEVLGEIGDVSCREALQRVLFEDEGEVVAAARQSLAAVQARLEQEG